MKILNDMCSKVCHKEVGNVGIGKGSKNIRINDQRASTPDRCDVNSTPGSMEGKDASQSENCDEQLDADAICDQLTLDANWIDIKDIETIDLDEFLN